MSTSLIIALKQNGVCSTMLLAYQRMQVAPGVSSMKESPPNLKQQRVQSLILNDNPELQMVLLK